MTKNAGPADWPPETQLMIDSNFLPVLFYI